MNSISAGITICLWRHLIGAILSLFLFAFDQGKDKMRSSEGPKKAQVKQRRKLLPTELKSQRIRFIWFFFMKKRGENQFVKNPLLVKGFHYIWYSVVQRLNYVSQRSFMREKFCYYLIEIREGIRSMIEWLANVLVGGGHSLFNRMDSMSLPKYFLMLFHYCRQSHKG